MLNKKSMFSSVVLLSAIAFLTVPLLKAGSDSAELTEELLCDNPNVSACYCLFEIDLLTANSPYNIQGDKPFLEKIVSYLAQHEKSPPQAVV